MQEKMFVPMVSKYLIYVHKDFFVYEDAIIPRVKSIIDESYAKRNVDKEFEWTDKLEKAHGVLVLVNPYTEKDSQYYDSVYFIFLALFRRLL